MKFAAGCPDDASAARHLAPFTILPLDEAIWDGATEIFRTLRKAGVRIGVADTLIAATDSASEVERVDPNALSASEVERVDPNTLSPPHSEVERVAPKRVAVKPPPNRRIEVNTRHLD